jgi:hypothetical protein
MLVFVANEANNGAAEKFVKPIFDPTDCGSVFPNAEGI